MSALPLLLWMSARGIGSWAQFRGAAESLHLTSEEENLAAEDAIDTGQGALPLHQHLRLSFERLAHAEFFSSGCDDGWRIAPPILALREAGNEWVGLLCGARSPLASTAVQAAAARAGVALTAEEHQGMPATILLRGCLEPLKRVATELQIHAQLHASVAILTCTPAIDDLIHLKRKVLPVGPDWQIDRFDPVSTAWVPQQRLEAVPPHALLRFRYLYERHHYVTFKGVPYTVPGQIGKYIMLRKARRLVVSYSPTSETLTVPAICRPPLLIERALDLCSGRLPDLDRRTQTLTYTNVPSSVAQLATRLLRQEL